MCKRSQEAFRQLDMPAKDYMCVAQCKYTPVRLCVLLMRCRVACAM